MIRNLVILSVLIAAAGIYTVYDSRRTATETVIPAQTRGSAVPNFEFENLTGEKISLSDFKGKIVIVNFWASWCAPCAIEFPAMLRLARDTKKESFFLFLSADDHADDIEKFIKKYAEGPLPENVMIGRDLDMKIAKDIFGTYKLPETYILSRRFEIAEKMTGADHDWVGLDMRSKILGLHEQAP